MNVAISASGPITIANRPISSSGLFSVLNPGLNIGPDESGLLIGKTKLPLKPEFYVSAAPVRPHDALRRVGFGTNQKMTKFVGHHEAQKLGGVYSFLLRLRLDVPIKHACVDTVATAVPGHGSSEDILTEELAVVRRNDGQEQTIWLRYRRTNRGAIDPSHLDAGHAENCPGSFLCFP